MCQHCSNEADPCNCQSAHDLRHRSRFLDDLAGLRHGERAPDKAEEGQDARSAEDIAHGLLSKRSPDHCVTELSNADLPDHDERRCYRHRQWRAQEGDDRAGNQGEHCDRRGQTDTDEETAHQSAPPSGRRGGQA